MATVRATQRKLGSVCQMYHPRPITIRVNAGDPNDVDGIATMNLAKTAAEAKQSLPEGRSDGVLGFAYGKLHLIPARLDPVDQVRTEDAVPAVRGHDYRGRDAESSGHVEIRDDRDDLRNDIAGSPPYETPAAEVASLLDARRGASVSFRDRIRRHAGGLAATLLGILGGARIEEVIAFVDTLVAQAADPSTDLTAWERKSLREAGAFCALHGKPGVTLLTARSGADDRVGVLLWATHGALPPKVSEAIVFRALAAATAQETSVLLGSDPIRIRTLLNRAAKRTRALSLSIGGLGPTELKLGIKAADARLRTLLRRANRLSGEGASSIEAMLEEWIQLIGAYKGRKGRRAGRG